MIPQQLRNRRREYGRVYKSVPATVRRDRLIVPEGVVRVETSAPCFNCEAKGRCRHRPWLSE